VLVNAVIMVWVFLKMSANLIILTGIIYAYIAVEQAVKGNIGMSICYAGYSFANVGLYLLATK